VISNLGSADAGILLGRSGGGRSAVGSVQNVLSACVAASVAARAANVRAADDAMVRAANDSRTISVSSTLVVGVVLLHVDGDLGLAQHGLGDLLGNSPVHSHGLVTVLSKGLLDGDSLGNLNFARDLDGVLIVHDLGDSNLNLLDLVSANGHANGVRHHDSLGHHDNLVNVADGGDLNLLGDGLINRPVGHYSARDLDGLDVIHGVLNLLSGLAGNLDGLAVVDNLRPEGFNLLGAKRGVGLLYSVLLRNVGVNSASDGLGDSDAAG